MYGNFNDRSWSGCQSAGAKGNAFAHYDIGLIYLDLKEYDKAMAHAHKAYGLGVARPELRDRLRSVGKWVGADAGPASAAQAASTEAQAQDPTAPRTAPR